MEIIAFGHIKVQIFTTEGPGHKVQIMNLCLANPKMNLQYNT
jgi:hypothetical protein